MNKKLSRTATLSNRLKEMVRQLGAKSTPFETALLRYLETQSKQHQRKNLYIKMSLQDNTTQVVLWHQEKSIASIPYSQLYAIFGVPPFITIDWQWHLQRYLNYLACSYTIPYSQVVVLIKSDEDRVRFFILKGDQHLAELPGDKVFQFFVL